MRCRECLGSDWETVTKFIKEVKANISSRKKSYHLYQCRGCKRVVVATYNQFYGSNKI